jgi:hypothetical protein
MLRWNGFAAGSSNSAPTPLETIKALTQGDLPWVFVNERMPPIGSSGCGFRAAPGKKGHHTGTGFRLRLFSSPRVLLLLLE